jgi:hypothetical protein
VSSAKTTTKSVVSQIDSTEKEDSKKNIEINLEKIINIHQYLELALDAFEKMAHPKSMSTK